MKHRVIRFLLTFSLTVISLSFPSYYRLWAKPYRITKSNMQMPFHPEWEISVSEEKKERIASILSQQFTYLGKGVQSYAFLSADGEFVLKLFRLEHCKLRQGQSVRDFLRKKFEKKVRLIEEPFSKATNIFKASKATFDHMQEETGLLLVHLNPRKSDWPLLKIKDYLGFTHIIDPATTRFVLQKKAVKMFPALSKALQEDREAFYRMIRSFSSLLQCFEKYGIGVEDSKMPSNFGFLGEKAVQIDFASNSGRPEDVPHQMAIFRNKLRCWLQKKAPDALQFLE
jgi:hypothetical protein